MVGLAIVVAVIQFVGGAVIAFVGWFVAANHKTQI